jgi:hypothetical protein
MAAIEPVPVTQTVPSSLADLLAAVLILRDRCEDAREADYAAEAATVRMHTLAVAAGAGQLKTREQKLAADAVALYEQILGPGRCDHTWRQNIEAAAALASRLGKATGHE